MKLTERWLLWGRVCLTCTFWTPPLWQLQTHSSLCLPKPMPLMTRERRVGSFGQSTSPGTDLLVEMSRQMGEGLNVSHKGWSGRNLIRTSARLWQRGLNGSKRTQEDTPNYRVSAFVFLCRKLCSDKCVCVSLVANLVKITTKRVSWRVFSSCGCIQLWTPHHQGSVPWPSTLPEGWVNEAVISQRCPPTPRPAYSSCLNHPQPLTVCCTNECDLG